MFNYTKLNPSTAFVSTVFDLLNLQEPLFFSLLVLKLFSGDRPMSDPGLGPPVDQLDAVCKAYKVTALLFR